MIFLPGSFMHMQRKFYKHHQIDQSFRQTWKSDMIKKHLFQIGIAVLCLSLSACTIFQSSSPNLQETKNSNQESLSHDYFYDMRTSLAKAYLLHETIFSMSETPIPSSQAQVPLNRFFISPVSLQQKSLKPKEIPLKPSTTEPYLQNVSFLSLSHLYKVDINHQLSLIDAWEQEQERKRIENLSIASDTGRTGEIIIDMFDYAPAVPQAPTMAQAYESLLSTITQLHEFGLGISELQRPITLTMEPIYDIPMVKHKRVDQAMKYYLNKGRRSLQTGIRRSQQYLPLIKSILKEEGLPQDLAYLAAVESNYNPRARSHAGAVGMWQFVSSTGRQYKLNQTKWIDERMDVPKSTKAAAKYLKYLYGLFGEWDLALAAYNSGEGRVQRTIRKAKKRGKPTDYWSLRLPRETQRYVGNFMAVTQISKNLEKYGLDQLEPKPPLQLKQLTLSTDFSLKEVADRSKIPFKIMLDLNPAYIRAIPPLDKKQYQVYIPDEAHKNLELSLKKNPTPQIEWKSKAIVKDNSKRMTKLLSQYGSPVYFRVKKGDNLWKLAKKHSTTISRLRAWNNLKKNSVLRINQRLKVYIPTWKVFAQLSQPVKKKPHRITVRPGDTLSQIARKYRVSIKTLMRWNKLPHANSLRAYQKLVVAYR